MSENSGVMVDALKFFLGYNTQEDVDSESDSDDEEDET